MICLWQLMILHARLGGYIRDHGLAVMAVFGTVVISFSWWGVNLLGVGLHTYGFTQGALTALVQGEMAGKYELGAVDIDAVI